MILNDPIPADAGFRGRFGQPVQSMLLTFSKPLKLSWLILLCLCKRNRAALAANSGAVQPVRLSFGDVPLPLRLRIASRRNSPRLW